MERSTFVGAGEESLVLESDGWNGHDWTLDNFWDGRKKSGEISLRLFRGETVWEG